MLELIGLGIGAVATWMLIASAVTAGALAAYVLVKVARKVLDMAEMAWQGFCRWIGA